jgi:hypothetical protein
MPGRSRAESRLRHRLLVREDLIGSWVIVVGSSSAAHGSAAHWRGPQTRARHPDF